MQYPLVWGSTSDVGNARAVNEDSVLTAPPVFLVADGMGGHDAGDQASAIVTQEFAPAAEDEVSVDWIIERFHAAHSRIRSGSGGGTTVAGAAVIDQGGDPYWLIFNVGDSRIYQLHGESVTQLSVDHSVVQELVDAGRLSVDFARTHPQRHLITRAVGIDEEPRPDFWLVPCVTGERLMMCSDGLTTELDEDQIGNILRRREDPETTASALVAAALEAGGRDNVSVVVVDVPGSGAHRAPEPDAVNELTAKRPRRQKESGGQE